MLLWDLTDVCSHVLTPGARMSLLIDISLFLWSFLSPAFSFWNHTVCAVHIVPHCDWHLMEAAEERMLYFGSGFRSVVHHGEDGLAEGVSGGSSWLQEGIRLLWLEPTPQVLPSRAAPVAIRLCYLGQSPKGSIIFQKSTPGQGPNAQTWAWGTFYIQRMILHKNMSHTVWSLVNLPWQNTGWFLDVCPAFSMCIVDPSSTTVCFVWL